MPGRRTHTRSSVSTVPAGLSPTYLAAVAGDGDGRAIVLNTGSSDATLFRQGADGFQRMARARLEDDDLKSDDPNRRLAFTKWYKGAFSEPASVTLQIVAAAE